MDVVDKVFGKNKSKLIYGKYRAIVKDINDPEKLGRIKVLCPEIYGKDNSPWAWPCSQYGGSSQTGMLFIPELDSGVWIEFEQGHITNPIWTGCWWTKLNGTNEMPTEALTNYGEVKIIKTKSGNTIIINDNDGSITISSLNNLKLNHIGGASIEISHNDVSITCSGNLKLNGNNIT